MIRQSPGDYANRLRGDNVVIPWEIHKHEVVVYKLYDLTNSVSMVECTKFKLGYCDITRRPCIAKCIIYDTWVLWVYKTSASSVWLSPLQNKNTLEWIKSTNMIKIKGHIYKFVFNLSEDSINTPVLYNRIFWKLFHSSDTTTYT